MYGLCKLSQRPAQCCIQENPPERRSPMDRSRPRSQGASSPRRRESPKRERKEEENKRKKRRRERTKTPDKKRRKRSKSPRETETIMATASKAPPLQPPRRPLDIATIVGLWRPPLLRPPPRPQFALIESSSSPHFGACNALGASNRRPPLLMRPPLRPGYGWGQEWQRGPG